MTMKDEARAKLSADLQPLYDMELEAGNSVVRVDEPAGTLCPLAIVMKNPIDKDRLGKCVQSIPSIFWHENNDQHYEAHGMGGYTSTESRQFLYGPLTSSK